VKCYQERAEEDEGDEVRNGDVTAALPVWRLRALTDINSGTVARITVTTTHTRQHDLLPALTRSAPVRHTH